MAYSSVYFSFKKYLFGKTTRLDGLNGVNIDYFRTKLTSTRKPDADILNNQLNLQRLFNIFSLVLAPPSHVRHVGVIQELIPIE